MPYFSRGRLTAVWSILIMARNWKLPEKNLKLWNLVPGSPVLKLFLLLTEMLELFICIT
jgi:hypothetical protein